MHLALGNDAAVAEWLGAKLDTQFHPPFVTMRVEDEQGKIHGAFLFNNYNGFSVEWSAFGSETIRKPYLRAVMKYAFDQLGVLYLRATTKRSNKRVVAILPRLGFEYEGTMKRYFGPAKKDDALVFRLDREHMKEWLK